MVHWLLRTVVVTAVVVVGGGAGTLRAHVEADCSYYVALRDAALEGAPAAFALGGRWA